MTDRAITVAAWESLFRAQVSVMRALAAEFPSEIISLNEYDVLFNITRAPGRRLRLKDLNRTVLITQPSVSRLVDRLAARGFVTKMHDPDDGRGTIVAITAEGFDLFRSVAFTLPVRPSSNFTCVLSRVLTSASAGPAVNTTSGRAIATILNLRFIPFPPGQSAIVVRASASMTRLRTRRCARVTPASRANAHSPSRTINVRQTPTRFRRSKPRIANTTRRSR